MDLAILLPLLKTTSNVALACRGFAWRVKSNGFPTRTSEEDLCLNNLSFYKSLGCPGVDEWMRKAIFSVIRDGDAVGLKLLLEYGADPDAEEMNRDTPLIFASELGETECMQILLERGANIEAENIDGFTALLTAAGHEKIDPLRLLLERGVDIERASVHGNTALIWAAWQCKLDCLQLLLEYKADVEAKDNLGRTALNDAVIRGKTDCLKILLQYGAKVSPEVRERYPEYADMWGDSTL